jgi:hypothetical protein
MFIGHFAVAFAAKRAVPKVSLGTLFLAAQFVDLLWPLFLLCGLEHVRVDPGNTAFTPLDFYDYPWTHSLFAALAWSVVLGGVFFALRRTLRSAAIVSLVVFSHWILDLITHRPDLPLGFGNRTYFGLGLWHSIAGTATLESAMYISGVWLYLRATSAQDRTGTYGLWTLILLLACIYTANIFGPPPPDALSIAIIGNAAWLFIPWSFWVDRHRHAA